MTDHAPSPTPAPAGTGTAVNWMPEVLDMIRERLEAYLGASPIAPMFYDDAITAVAHRAAFGKLPEEMYPEGSLLHRARAAEESVATLTRQLAEAQQDTARLDWLEAEEWEHRLPALLERVRLSSRVTHRIRTAIDHTKAAALSIPTTPDREG